MIIARQFVWVWLLACASLGAQQTWRVRCGVGGPAVDFDDLPQAVAAASPGDTIRVFLDFNVPCGNNFRFTPAVIDKPLTIVGVRMATPTVWLDYMELGGVLQIRDIPAGERVVIRGFFLYGDGPFLVQDRGLEAVNCAGQIVLDRLDINGLGFGGAVVRFTDCADVVVHDSEFVMAQRPVEVVRSNVRFTNCLIRHGAPISPFPQTFFNTSPGISVEEGKVSLDITTVYGADDLGLPGMVRQRAVVLDRGVLEVGPDTALFAGQPWPAATYSTDSMGLSEVALDPRGYIQNLPTSLHAQPVARDLHTTMYNRAAPGESFDFTIAGPPNGYGILVLGAHSTSGLPSPLGDVWLDPQALSVVTCQALDAQGFYDGVLAVSSGIGSPFVYGLQSLLVGPNGSLEVSRSTPFLLGWQTNLAPSPSLRQCWSARVGRGLRPGAAE